MRVLMQKCLETFTQIEADEPFLLFFVFVSLLLMISGRLGWAAWLDLGWIAKLGELVR